MSRIAEVNNVFRHAGIDVHGFCQYKDKVQYIGECKKEAEPVALFVHIIPHITQYEKGNQSLKGIDRLYDREVEEKFYNKPNNINSDDPRNHLVQTRIVLFNLQKPKSIYDLYRDSEWGNGRVPEQHVYLLEKIHHKAIDNYHGVTDKNQHHKGIGQVQVVSHGIVEKKVAQEDKKHQPQVNAVNKTLGYGFFLKMISVVYVKWYGARVGGQPDVVLMFALQQGEYLK
jgi:hypothetical protein